MELCYTCGQTKYWRPAQVAARLRVSPDSIRKYCASGRIPAARTLGGAYLIPNHVLYVLEQAVRERTGGATLAAIVASVREQLRPVKPKPKATNEPKPEATNEPAIG
jgi:excisionase family DNA binding protein